MDRAAALSSNVKGLYMEVRELYKKAKKTMMPLELEELLKKKRKEDDKLVHGMFEFIDAHGGFMDFAYRKYPGEAIKMIKITHGDICDLPLGIVKHLNNTKRKVRKYDLTLPPVGGKPMRSFELQSRVKFTPLDVI